MAFSAALSHVSFSTTSSSSSSSTRFLTRNPRIQLIPIQFRIRAVQSSEPAAQKSDAETKVQDSPPPTTKPPLKPKKPVYSSQYTHTFMFTYRLQRAGFCIISLLTLLFFLILILVKKGQIVRVDKEKYLNSVNVRV